MTDEDALERNLPRWLEPAGVQLDNERIALYRAAVRDMSEALAGRELDVVRAAHGHLTDEVRAWVGELMREHDQTFVGEGKDMLLARLAGAAVINALLSGANDAAILTNLAVESARFLGLDAVLPDLADLSARQLSETAREVRERVEIDPVVATKLPGERKPDPEQGVVITPDDLARDVFALSRTVKGLVNHISAADRARARSETILAEETEILWWVLLGRTENGALWAELAPEARAIRAAHELKRRTALFPGTPAAAYFLRRTLDGVSEQDTTITDLAEPAFQIDDFPDASDSLMPILSSVRAYREMEGDARLARGLAGKKYGVPVRRKVALADASEQLYREFQMHEALSK